MRRANGGATWLVADRAEPPGFHCYWYAGRNDDHLVEHAHVVGEAEAVAWARQRTTRVRIRTADARTSWAGTAPRPAGISRSWMPSC